MRNHRITSYLLLGYLALLLNVGPSAHHAEIFGLHGSGCCAHSTDANAATSHNCSDHDHSHRHDLATQQSGVVNLLEGSGLHTHCGDCALCQYFDNFHAIKASFELHLNQSPVRSQTMHNRLNAIGRPIVCSARGPPAHLVS